MDFKKICLNIFVVIAFLIICIIAVVFWKSSFSSLHESMTANSISSAFMPTKPEVIKPQESELKSSKDEDADIEREFDRQREEQRKTKDLKNKLEQTTLELDQEKALVEINKLKMENIGSLKESDINGQKNLPEVIVEYIGGDSVRKEAVLSIGGVNFQVKEKSIPADNIQVLAITDSSVTVHFRSPENLTKTIDYKPE